MCPKCGRTIELESAASRVKLRCGGCNAVFITSVELAEEDDSAHGRTPAESPAGGEETSAELAELAAAGSTPRHGRRKKRRRSSPFSLIVVLMGLASAGIGAYAAWWVYQHPYVEIDTGDRVIKGRFTREEIARMRDEAEQQIAERQLANRQEQVVGGDPGSEFGTSPGWSETDEVDYEPEQQTPAGPTVARLDVDKQVRVTARPSPVTRADGTSYIVGELINDHDRPLQRVEVVVSLADAENQPLGRVRATADWVPVGGRAMFSARLAGIEAEKIAAVEAAAVSPMLADASEACRAVAPDAVDTQTVAETVKLSGEVRNDTDAPLTDAEIFCDLYSDDDVLIDTVKGRLDEPGGRIAPGQARPFTAAWDAAAAFHRAGLVRRVDVRLVATRPS